MSLSEGPVTSVPRLLAPHDAEFITTAYQSVLGRTPDAEGRAYYLSRLRAGTHKLEILRQLRRSAEGRTFIPGVAGLDRAIRRHNLANLPLMGPIVRLMTGAEGNGATQRQLRVIANEIGQMRHEQAVLMQAGVAVNDRLVKGGGNSVASQQSQAEERAGDSNIITAREFPNQPVLANTLEQVKPAASIEHFLSQLQASVTASHEATVLRRT